jgi:hypothetical protein
MHLVQTKEAFLPQLPSSGGGVATESQTNRAMDHVENKRKNRPR